ncbi:MAG: type II secretion system F family protein [bacterium]
MPFFKYKVVNKDYEKEQGTIEAASEQQVENVLLEKGYQIISVRKSLSDQLFKHHFNRFFNRVKAKDLVVFFRQFSVLISASITLTQSLRILSDQIENPSMRSILIEVSNDVDTGERLSDSMEKHGSIFSDFHVSVVRSGEKSGKLDESLGYLADEEEKNYDIVKKLKNAMMYPAIVLTAMITVGILMMIFVVPKLVDIFEEVGGQLPIMTRILIATSSFLVNFWWLVIIFVIALVTSVKFFSKKPFGRKQIDYIALRLPIFGKIIQKMNIIHFARSMSTLIVGGVTISNALKITRSIVTNNIFKEIVSQTIIEVEQGNSISTVFSKSKEVPSMVPKMMIVGEKTGKLDFVLERINAFYTKELDATLENLMVLLEPVIMIIMGVAVGLMAAAIILPMYSLTSQF